MSLYLGENLISGQTTLVGESRNIGQIIPSAIPLTDAGLHLLDGALIQGGGIYSAFVDYIAGLYEADPTASYFAQGYIEELTFNQPALSANGTLGGDSFAVSASSQYSSSYQAYMAFDSSTSTEWVTQGTHNPCWIIFYNPNPLKVTLLTMRNRTSQEAFTGGNIYGSNDNSTWELLTTYTNSATAANATWTIDLSSNTNYYNYYKIEGTSFTGTNQGFTNIAITATYQGNTHTPEQAWQASVTQYGVCGKFVYDSVNNTVRLPKYSNKIYTQELDATAPVVGNGTSLGLTNGTDLYSLTNSDTYKLAFHTGVYGMTIPNTSAGSWINGSFSTGVTTDPTKSGIIAQLSDITTSLDGYYYIVIATSTKTDIEVDIDEVATDLNGKADVDLTNVNNQAKILMSGMGMPSDTFIDLTLGASGTTYTAPANGYFYLCKIAGSDWYYINGTVIRNGTPLFGNFDSDYRTSPLKIILNVLKGDSVQIDYNATGATTYFRFIYAVGSESEVS